MHGYRQLLPAAGTTRSIHRTERLPAAGVILASLRPEALPAPGEEDPDVGAASGGKADGELRPFDRGDRTRDPEEYPRPPPSIGDAAHGPRKEEKEEDGTPTTKISRQKAGSRSILKINKK